MPRDPINSSLMPNEDWGKYFKADSGIIVDLGCGFGGDACYLASKGYKVLAVDEENNLKFNNPNVEFIKQDIAAPIQGKFDGVISCFSLHCLEPKPRLGILKHYLDSLKPGGIFYILTFQKILSPLFFDQFPQKPEVFFYDEEDDHPPVGKHVHQVARIVYIKK